VSWGKLDDKLHSHPKVQKTSEKDVKRLAAMGLWSLVLSHNCDYLLDGVIDRGTVIRIAGNAKLADELAWCLVTAGLWEVRGEEHGGGWVFHDWEKYRPSRAEVEATRAKRSESGRIGGQQSGKTRRERGNQNEANDEASASVKTKQNEAKANPDPVPDPDPVPQKDQKILTSPDGTVASTRRKTATNKPKEPPTTDFARVIDAYHAEFLRHRGAKPVIDKRAGQAAKKLLELMPADDVVALIHGAFEDDFFARTQGELWQIANAPNKFRRGVVKAPPVFQRPQPPPAADGPELTFGEYQAKNADAGNGLLGDAFGAGER
jgi:hypothetical protein